MTRLILAILIFIHIDFANAQDVIIETKETAIGYIQYHSETQELWVWNPRPEDTGIHHQILAVIFKTDSSTVFTVLAKSVALSGDKSKKIMKVSIVRDGRKLVCHSIDIQPLKAVKNNLAKSKKTVKPRP